MLSGVTKSKSRPPTSSARPLRPLPMMPITKRRSSLSLGLNTITFSPAVIEPGASHCALLARGAECRVHVFGIGFESFLAELQGRGRVRRCRNPEQIATAQLSIPAAKPIEALLLLLKLGKRVLPE